MAIKVRLKYAGLNVQSTGEMMEVIVQSQSTTNVGKLKEMIVRIATRKMEFGTKIARMVSFRKERDVLPNAQRICMILEYHARKAVLEEMLALELNVRRERRDLTANVLTHVQKVHTERGTSVGEVVQ